MTSIQLSIIVVNWNTCDLVEKCLRSVYETAEALHLEILLVDNASSDGSVHMVRTKFPGVRILENKENLGFAKANNQAFRYSTGRYLLLLNSDAELRTSAMEQMCRFLDQHPDVAGVGPKLINPNGSFQSSYMRFPTLFGEFLLATKLSRLFYSPQYPSGSEVNSGQTREADWVSGACLLIRRKALDQVGELDERIFMYAEEVDWCWRAKQSGWKIIYLPDAEVAHWGGRSIGQTPLVKRMRVYSGKIQFFRKSRGNLYASIYKVMILVVTLIKMVVTSLALLVPRRTIRERAWHNLRSYSVVMTVFSRGTFGIKSRWYTRRAER